MPFQACVALPPKVLQDVASEPLSLPSGSLLNPLLDTKPSFPSLEAVNHPDGLPPHVLGLHSPDACCPACLHHLFNIYLNLFQVLGAPVLWQAQLKVTGTTQVT